MKAASLCVCCGPFGRREMEEFFMVLNLEGEEYKNLLHC